MASAPAVEGWFTTGDAPRLIGARCGSCSTYVFPPTAATCPNPSCGAPELSSVELSPTGTIWSFAINHYPPPPPSEIEAPYGVAAVHLAEENLVVLGRVASGADLDSLAVGDQVELALEPVAPGADEVTWAWSPR